MDMHSTQFVFQHSFGWTKLHVRVQLETKHCGSGAAGGQKRTSARSFCRSRDLISCSADPITLLSSWFLSCDQPQGNHPPDQRRIAHKQLTPAEVCQEKGGDGAMGRHCAAFFGPEVHGRRVQAGACWKRQVAAEAAATWSCGSCRSRMGASRGRRHHRCTHRRPRRPPGAVEACAPSCSPHSWRARHSHRSSY